MFSYIIFAAGLVPWLSSETKAKTSDWGRVEVVRDEWGIPHIFAEPMQERYTVWATPRPRTAVFRCTTS